MPMSLNQGIELHLWPVREHLGIGVMPLSFLCTFVPDPEREENAAAIKSDPRLRQHAEVRKGVQRLIKNTAKGRNIGPYADYIAAGLRGDYGDAWSTPAVCLWTAQDLQPVPLPELADIATVHVPLDIAFTAIDAETQVAALHKIYNDPEGYDLPEEVRNTPVQFELYWGIEASDARQIFHDRNLRAVQVSKTLALSMDKRDVATQIAEQVISTTTVTVDGIQQPLAKFVNRSKRQLGKTDPEWLTLSGVRSMAVTALLGKAGIAHTSGVIDSHNDLPAGVDEDTVVREVAHILGVVFREMSAEFAARSAITAPAVLAGVGAVAHHATTWCDGIHIKPETVVEALSEVHWERKADVWQGVAAKTTPKGGLSFAGGVKDSGYRVYDALMDANSDNGAQIRGRRR